MCKKIDQLIDSLVPRGGERPNSIHVSLEEYLSRLSNFNRKLKGVNYRMDCWTLICKEHKAKFDEKANSKEIENIFLEQGNSKKMTFYYPLREIRIENEFEMLLYSITSTLSTLSRVIACFIKGSTQIHSHTKLPDILLKQNEFKQLHSMVARASGSWTKDLADRRDASTHYIALGITSSLTHSKAGSHTTKKPSYKLEFLRLQ